MAQVAARIVIAQADNAAPGGYTGGSRDGLLLNKLVTLTNASNASATSHTWEVFPAVGLTEGAYGVSGKESASCTLTPPASTGYGDLAVRLTVRGDPLPNGRPNVAVDEVILGVRAPLSGEDLPLPHPHESLAGGRLVLSAVLGVIGRIVLALRLLYLQLSGGDTELAGDAVGPAGANNVVALRGVLIEEAAEGAGEEDGATLLSRQEAWTLIHGELSKSITAGGVITLNDGEHECHVLRLTGSPASDTTVKFPPIPGRTWTVTNEQDAASRAEPVYLLADGGGRAIYLGPGATRRVTIIDGELDDDAGGQAIVVQITVSLVRGSAGNTDVVLCTLPSGTNLRGATTHCEADPVGANVTAVMIGTSAGGEQIQKSVPVPLGGESIGDDPTDDWGSDLAATGRKTYADSTTLHLRFTTDGEVTDGQVTVTIEAVRLTR